jgi:hypothetical protein
MKGRAVEEAGRTGAGGVEEEEVSSTEGVCGGRETGGEGVLGYEVCRGGV